MLAESVQDLYLEERRQAILELMAASGRVTVADLSRRFGVSAVTIRGDLQALAERNLLIRTHGGAVLGADGRGELALALRRQRQVGEKARIGEAGAGWVEDGDAVFLDSSSTSLAIARYLRRHRHVTVLTNSLAVAQELVDAPGVHVVITGGALQKETASLIGPESLVWLAQYHLQRGFFGAHGISEREGLTDVSTEQAEFKRPLVQMCRQVIAVIDSSKWGRVGIASFAPLGDVDVIISDRGAPAEAVTHMRQLGIDVHLV